MAGIRQNMRGQETYGTNGALAPPAFLAGAGTSTRERSFDGPLVVDIAATTTAGGRKVGRSSLSPAVFFL